MAELGKIARHVRSKNAGPFWVTVDIFFKDHADFDRYAKSPALGPQLFAELYGADPALVKHIAVRSLDVLKVSYPRPQAQGWRGERDMHQGQSFARLLSAKL
ncbi:MAG TPA: DUF4387 domain-containing protein [Caulobacteraceae bacterium]|jgi:hypothetical protein